MSNEAQKSMSAYADMIEVINSDCEKVRRTPDVFIGQLGSKAVLAMAREVVQNSFDIIRKSMLPNSPIFIQDSEVIISYDERTYEFQVTDHGSGIPFGKLDSIFSQTHSGSSYHKMDGDFGAGKNGCGAAVTNFLSEYFSVETYVSGLGGHVIKYDHGFVSEPEHEIPKKDCKIIQGTVTTWKPDITAIGDFSDITWQTIFDLMSRIVPLASIGTKLVVNITDKESKDYKFVLENKKGMFQLLDMLTTKPMMNPIRIQKQGSSVNPIKKNIDGTPFNDSLGIDALITYDAGDMSDMKIMAFANTSPSIDGTHMSGVVEGICKFFKDYMNNIYLANAKTKLEIIDKDIRTGLVVVIAAGHTSASYNAQNKEILDNKDMKPFAKKSVMEALDEWSKSNPNDMNKLCKYFKEIGTLRLKQDSEKQKIAKNYETSALSGGFPTKYVKPNGTKHLELFLVEGNSALGTVKTAIDKRYQGIYPLRGKSINNAMKYSRAVMMNNEEVQAIVKILGIEPANPAKGIPCGDPAKCRFEKIIFLADADYDGYHINTLLLLFFIIYYPRLIEAGMVYRCVPPLYGAKVGSKMVYFPDEISYIKHVQNTFCHKNEILSEDKKPMSAKELTGLLYRTRHFVDKFCSAANNMGVHPLLLECILQNRMLPMNKFKAAMKKFERFIEVDTFAGKPYIHGAYNFSIYNVFMDDYFCQMTSEVVSTVDNEPSHLILNGKMVSLLEFCMAFKDFSPEVKRFKGLGENNPADLKDTAIRPTGNRTLIQYTMEDADRQIQEIRDIESNTLLFLQNLPEECKGDFE